MIKCVRLLIFLLIEIVLLPISITGYICTVCKTVYSSYRTKISSTALGPLSSRSMLNRLGLRKDELARKILYSLPSVSKIGLRLTSNPTFFAIKVSGYIPSFLQYPRVTTKGIQGSVLARTMFFDTAMTQYLNSVSQVVILGAGFDTRANNLCKGHNVKVFEVDTKETQPHKIAALEKAGADTSHITFVTVNFNTESWLEKLQQHGFDQKLPTFFLWEGVTYYVQPDAVKETFRTIAEKSAPGSAISFDYFSLSLIAGRNFGLSFLSYAHTIARLAGEPWVFGLDPAPDEIDKFVNSLGLSLEAHKHYGKEENPFGGMVTATVKSK